MGFKIYLRDRVKRDEGWHAEYVGHVFDGDTVMLRGSRGMCFARLWGIDAPEKGQVFFSQSRNWLSARVFRKRCQVQALGWDKYHRLLVRIRTQGGEDVNEGLVREGLAWWYFHFAPKAEELRKAQLSAMEDKRGIWSGARIVPPWVFRRTHKDLTEVPILVPGDV